VCKCSSFVAVCADDGNMIICCAPWVTYFLGDGSNPAPILFGPPLIHVFCRFSYCLEWNPLLDTLSRIDKLSWLEHFQQETLVWNFVNLWTLLVGRVFSIRIKWWNLHSNCRWFYRELIMSVVNSKGARWWVGLYLT